MANPNAPFGFAPVQRYDGAAWTGAERTMRIASGYSTSIFTGDFVKLISTGYINRCGAGDTYVGVFNGCKYIDATGKPVVSPYWPASTTTLGSQDVEALIIPADGTVFMAQMNATASIPADIGAVFNTTTTAGSTATGRSAMAVDYSTLTVGTTGSALQVRLLDVVKSPDNDPAGAYQKVLVEPVGLRSTSGT